MHWAEWRCEIHPRVRGEHGGTLTTRTRPFGSSSRARGTRRRRRRPRHRFRFIPACAGNTRARSPPNRRGSVHPRVRGEHSAISRITTGSTGSSPRARGTRAEGRREFLVSRFIPACAGNTPKPRARWMIWPVHPRVRGEHHGYRMKSHSLTGSSPRARGTLMDETGANKQERFIPACAGNTPGGCPIVAHPPVHPRVRGEHTFPWRRRETDARFIPACAGNTMGARASPRPCAVHPRVRGEHSHPLGVVALGVGSSPRARGTLGQEHGGFVRFRFIPACAGNTNMSSMR